MLRRPRASWLMALTVCAMCAPAVPAGEEHRLLAIMESELKLSMEKLEAPDGTKPYFLQYNVTDEKSVTIGATLGALTFDDASHNRYLDIDLRCGDYTLDSTHQIRDQGFGGRMGMFRGRTSLPLEGDALATRHALWLKTDEQFKQASKRLAQVQANVKVKVEEEDQSDDFTREDPEVYIGKFIEQKIDQKAWSKRVKKWSEAFRNHPDVYNSSVTLTGRVNNRLAVNSETSKLQFGRGWWRIGIQASTIADDGMELFQYSSFDAHTPEGLPGDATVEAAVKQVIAELEALRVAPLVEPYTGPAIFMNRASGVFFHEIFGHRIEGHRQKDVEEGQTFAKKIGKEVLPDFLSVTDDPTKAKFGNIELNGHYLFDEECVSGQPVHLVESGILKTFLLSRSPTRGFTKSNGHGRAQPGLPVVARQGNLMVESAKQVSFPKLREMLKDECRKQNKEYGLLFKDISGGFTTTRRFGPQAFKVLPIIVYKVYADGREDELVRGVDVVGTPLTCFSKILATADDHDVFNGICGAESGSVPVSAISPSILVEQIEIEKKQKAQDRPPILAPPIAANSK